MELFSRYGYRSVFSISPDDCYWSNFLGFVQQITRAFGRVEGSLQYLVKSWSTIVELISVWKRLREFELNFIFQKI